MVGSWEGKVISFHAGDLWKAGLHAHAARNWKRVWFRWHSMIRGGQIGGISRGSAIGPAKRKNWISCWTKCEFPRGIAAWLNTALKRIGRTWYVYIYIYIEEFESVIWILSDLPLLKNILAKKVERSHLVYNNISYRSVAK